MALNCPQCGETFEEVEVQLACEVHCPECGTLLSEGASPISDAKPPPGSIAPMAHTAVPVPPPPTPGARVAPPDGDPKAGAAPPADARTPATVVAPGAPVPAPPGGRVASPTPAGPAAPTPASIGTPAPVPAAPAAGDSGAGQPFGRYRLLAVLGQGGAGVVHKAYDTAQRRLVALKVLRTAEPGAAETAQRILHEARRAQKLHHPHILAVHEVGEQEGRPFVSVDFVEGRTFHNYLQQAHAAKPAAGKTPLDLLRHEVAILVQVAEAVGYAHSEGILHRDLKPANVLLDRKDRAYVMDFGLAPPLVLAADARLPESMVRAGAIAPAYGTPGAMSPEQILGDATRIGPRCDVWSLGVMLYEVLAGRPPFAGAGPAEVFTAVLDADPPPTADGPRPPTEDLESVYLHALEKDRERRMAGALEFAEDLKRWLRGEPVRARRPGLFTRLTRRLGF